MSGYLKVFLGLSLFFLLPSYCFAAGFTFIMNAMLNIQITIVDILNSMFWYVLGVGSALVAIFYAGRILKQLKVIFAPPPPQ